MKKVLCVNEEVKVLLELKEVLSVNAETLQEERIKTIGMITYKNGKIVKADNLPENDLGQTLREISNYNQKFVFGTTRQIELLEENNIEVDLKNRATFNQAISLLESNDLLVDRGFTFGKRTLIMPIPNNVLQSAEMLLN